MVLDDGEREALRELGRSRRWRRGAALYQEGDRSDWVALIERGRVKVCSVDRDGRETFLALRGPGDLLGELSALDGRPRSASLVALEALEATVIEAAAFREYLRARPAVALELLAMISTRLRDADRKRAEFGAQDTTGRVAARLVELAGRFGQADEEGIRVAVPLTQQDLAGWVGASREAVSRSLRALRDRGLVQTDRGVVTVLDLEALRRRCS